MKMKGLQRTRNQNCHKTNKKVNLLYIFNFMSYLYKIRKKITLSVLMLCAPSNRRRPFSYHTKMADFEYFRVLSVSS